MCKFSHLLTGGLIKWLSPNKDIFNSFSIEMHYYIVHYDRKPSEQFFKCSFEIPHLPNRDWLTVSVSASGGCLHPPVARFFSEKYQ